MKTKVLVVAGVAALLAIAVIGVAILLLRREVIEEWNITRFHSGDEAAKSAALDWMEKSGGEESLLALVEFYLQSDPWPFLAREYRSGPPDLDLMEPLARKRYLQLKAAPDPRTDNGRILTTLARIEERLGKDGQLRVTMKLLRNKTGSAKLKVSTSRAAIMSDPKNPLDPEAVELAVQRLRENLPNADPLVRAGAAYGLADAGPRVGPGTIKAIAPLLDDPEPFVHEAAVYAINRLSSPGTAEELPH